MSYSVRADQRGAKQEHAAPAHGWVDPARTRILDGSKFASKFEEDIRECTLEWVEGAGHVPHLEKPDVTSDLIEDFLKPLLSSE